VIDHDHLHAAAPLAVDGSPAHELRTIKPAR
jgi:hypothetical protein